MTFENTEEMIAYRKKYEEDFKLFQEEMKSKFIFSTKRQKYISKEEYYKEIGYTNMSKKEQRNIDYELQKLEKNVAVINRGFTIWNYPHNWKGED